MLAQVCLAMCLASWFIALDLENAYGHVLLGLRHQWFLAVGVRYIALKFTMLPFRLNVVP